jgi:hypothetical protein
MIRRHLRLRRAFLALAFAVLVAPAAAQAVTGVMVDTGLPPGIQQTDARHAALLVKNRHDIITAVDPRVSPFQLKVQAMRLNAMANQYQSQSSLRSENSFGVPGPSAGGATGPQTTVSATSSSSDSFDWGSAGIGAGIVLGGIAFLLIMRELGRRNGKTGLAKA